MNEKIVSYIDFQTGCRGLQTGDFLQNLGKLKEFLGESEQAVVVSGKNSLLINGENNIDLVDYVRKYCIGVSNSMGSKYIVRFNLLTPIGFSFVDLEKPRQLEKLIEIEDGLQVPGMNGILFSRNGDLIKKARSELEEVCPNVYRQH